MPRATGANAKLRIAEETAGYGVQATTGFVEVPFVSYGNSASQGLVASDLLGLGREPAPPSQDTIEVGGSAVVPVDLRNIGHWLKFVFGPPLSRPVRATGSFAFSAQPAINSTLTLGGTVWTFVASGASGAQTNIGANLAATLTALATNLNASGDANISLSTYSATATALVVRSKTWGGGNAFALAASSSPASNATRAGATLSGGGFEHRFRSGGPRARGRLTFSAQPADASTLSIGGTSWTFVAGTPSAGQTQIQATLADTLAQLAEDLAASADANLVRASFGASATHLTVELRDGGLQAAFAIAGTSGANATPTSSTALALAAELPSFTAELALPDVGTFFVAAGNKADSAAFDFQRSGNAAMTVAIRGQSESESAATQAGTPAVLAIQRLSQFQGSISSGGSPIASVTGAGLTYANNLDPVATIRSDGKIDGYDEGTASVTGKIDARFTEVATYRAAAAAGTPLDLSFAYTRSAHELLRFDLPAVYLPVAKKEVTGPRGIDANYDFQGAKSGAWSLQATLRNDLAGY